VTPHARVHRVSWLRLALAWWRMFWRRGPELTAAQRARYLAPKNFPIDDPHEVARYSCGCMITLTGPIVHTLACPRTCPPAMVLRHVSMDYPPGDPRRPRS
jgi:hypothetical protein